MSLLTKYKSLGDIAENIGDIRAHVDDAGFSILRGVVPDAEVQAVKQRVLDRFHPKTDVRISGHYKRGGPDFQRLDLGEYLSNSRFARYFFYFPWNNDRVFEKINNLQMTLLGRLAGKDDSFGSMSKAESNPSRFRMSYVIQYPLGGGFMSKHREYTVQEEGDKAYVVYLALTSRGTDYDKGGAYIYRNDEKIDIEKEVRQGDLVIYRGDRFHGVDGIDKDKPVELDRVCGRMILNTVVSYFKD